MRTKRAGAVLRDIGGCGWQGAGPPADRHIGAAARAHGEGGAAARVHGEDNAAARAQHAHGEPGAD